MPVLTGRIDPHDGPIIEVKLLQSPRRVAALRRDGLGFSAPVEVAAPLDTGASCSAADRSIIQRLGLSQHGTANIHTPSTGGAYQARGLFDASIVIGAQLAVPLEVTVELIESDFTTQGFLDLIGRDVLGRCVLTCDGPRKTYSLEW